MSSYELVEPFDVDDGQLDGLSQSLVFTLGVEWATFLAKLYSTSDGFTDTIHRENANRLSAMCDRHGRFCEVQPCPILAGFADDYFEEWRQIVVGNSKDATR